MSIETSLAIGDRGLRSFAIAFAITQVVEVPIYVAALGRAKVKRRVSTRAAIAFGASAITHPIVWFVMPAVSMALYGAWVAWLSGGRTLDELGRTLVYGVLAEGLAVTVEALYLRAFGVRRPFAWAIAANGASVVVGSLLVRGLGL